MWSHQKKEQKRKTKKTKLFCTSFNIQNSTSPPPNFTPHASDSWSFVPIEEEKYYYW